MALRGEDRALPDEERRPAGAVAGGVVAELRRRVRLRRRGRFGGLAALLQVPEKLDPELLLQ